MNLGAVENSRLAGDQEMIKRQSRTGIQQYTRTESTRKERTHRSTLSLNGTFNIHCLHETSQDFFWLEWTGYEGSVVVGRLENECECFGHIIGKVMSQQSHSTRELE